MLSQKWQRWQPVRYVAIGGTLAIILVYSSLNYYEAHRRYYGGPTFADRKGNRIAYRQIYYYKDWVAMDEAIGWVAVHAAPRDIVGASMPHWVYLRTGLKSVLPPLESNPAKAKNFLDSLPVRYLIDEGPAFFPTPYVKGVVKTYPSEWKLVFTAKADDVRVYENTLRR